MKKTNIPLLAVVFAFALCIAATFGLTGCFKNKPTSEPTQSSTQSSEHSDNTPESESASDSSEESALDSTNESTFESVHTHEFVEIADNAFLKSEATCQEKAQYYLSCACGEKSSETFEYGELSSHMAMIDEGIEATCTKSGRSAGKHCSVCNEILEAQTVIPALGHNIVIHEAKLPTCTEAGCREYQSCLRCSYTTYVEIPALEHDWKETIIIGEGKEICNSEYLTADRCQRCGLVDDSSLVHHDKAEHDYSDGVCTRCGDIEPTDLNYFTFTLLDDDTYSIRANETYKTSLPQDLLLPSLYNGKPVTKIADDAFPYCEGLNSISIPSSITSIGELAFAGCSGLTKMIIPDSVTSIGSAAFDGCSGMTSVTIGKGTENIGYGIFSCCIYSDSHLKEIIVSEENEKYYSINNCLIDRETKTVISGCNTSIIPTDGSVTSIRAGAFAGFKYLTNVIIPDGVTDIEDFTFFCCSGLTSITISNSVTCIGDSAFAGCSSLTSVTIPNSVTCIMDSAFNGCSSLISMAIPDGVTSIEYCVFYDCNSLTSVIIPDSVTSIGSSAFENCSGLASVIIPDSVTSIGSSAFYNCSGLASVIIPDSVTSVGRSAFYNCSGLVSVIIPDSVTSIGDSAFCYCNGLTSITIPDGVSSIGDSVFFGCDGLTSITIPDSVTSIGSSAFENCSGLASVTIPDSVTSIGRSAFCNCSGLTSVNYFGTIDQWAEIDFGDFDSNPLFYTKKLYINNELINEANLTTATKISAFAFNLCSGFTSITIPDSVTSVGEYAFNLCSGLTSVTIGNSVTSIGDSAFSNCKNLENITIPDSVTSIGDRAFWGCIGLISVNYLGDIESWCKIEFDNGSSNPLFSSKKFLINGEEIKNIVIPNTISEIKNYTFRGCNNLTSVIIPNSVTSIGVSAFSYCISLTSVIIPNSVTSIDAFAFSYCNSLTSVTIPDSVTNIGAEAFIDCNNLMSVDCWGDIESWCMIEFGSYYSNPLYYAKELLINGEKVKDLVIPDTITKIKSHAFIGCSSLMSIVIPNSVTWIGDYAFNSCNHMTSIAIPNSVTWIGNHAFSRCGVLKEIIVEEGNERYYSKDNCLIDKTTKTLIRGCNNSVIPTDGSVTSIGDEAFSDCNGLTDITIPSGITSIGFSAFEYCSRLTNVDIPDGVTSIESETFVLCESLISVAIPNSVTFIGYDTFRFCLSLTRINFNGTMNEWKAIIKGEDWNDGTGDYTVYCTDGKLDKYDNEID